MFRSSVSDEFAFKSALSGGQADASPSAPLPPCHRDIFLIQGLEEVGSSVRQGPVASAMGVHELQVPQVCQGEPHVMSNDVGVARFPFWWVFHPQKVSRDPQQLAKTPVERIEMYTATELSQGAKVPKHQAFCTEPRRRRYVSDLRNLRGRYISVPAVRFTGRRPAPTQFGGHLPTTLKAETKAQPLLWPHLGG